MSPATEKPSDGDGTPPQRPGLVRRTGRLIRRVYRLTRGLLALAMVVQILLLFVPAIDKVYLWLAVTSPPSRGDVIVCLGGHTTREVLAARLYHNQCAPVVVVSNAPGAAEAMKRLVMNCGVPGDRILVDNTSYTTGDHPTGIARLPGMDPQNQRFIIVTDHSHSRRAVACFRIAGYKHLSVYGGLPADRDIPPEYWERIRWRILVLPQVLYESAGLAQYWWRGRI